MLYLMFVAHYNRHRSHRARNLRPPDRDHIITIPVTGQAACQRRANLISWRPRRGQYSRAADTAARIRRRKVLGRLIHEHERAA